MTNERITVDSKNAAWEKAAEVLNTDASDKVIELLARLEGQARAELEQFGI